MTQTLDTSAPSTDPEVERFRIAQGPFVVAAEKTAMPMIFTVASPDKVSVVFANASFLELVDRPRHAILGRPLEELFECELEEQAGYRSLQSALASGREGEWRLPCRSTDGTRFWVSVFASPVRDQHGALTHNFLSFSKLDGGGKAFVERRDELAALYEQAPGFIAILEGPSHIFTFTNAAYKSFVNVTDVIGRTVEDALPTLAAQGFLHLLDNVYATGVAYVGTDVEFVFDYYAQTGLPEKRYCDFVWQPIRARDGIVKGLFVEGYDVTEKHLAAERMLQLQNDVIHLSRTNAMGTMAATLAHELNQPLTAIGNYSEAGQRHLALRDATGIDKAAHAFGAIRDLSQRTGSLIKNLRDMTAPRQSHWSEFDLSDAISECISLVEAAVGQTAEIADRTSDPMLVHGDRIQIQQVLINLLKNACESGGEPSQFSVEISASADDDHVRVCVKDTGTGVCAEAAATLFMLTQSRKAEGMGIGLSVSRTIIEGHGGRIWLEDTSSAGSLFCFTIPKTRS